MPDVRPQPIRVDSPLSNSSLNVAHTYMARERELNGLIGSTPPNASVQMDKPRTNSKTKPASLRFFVVDDPKQLKDKAQLKANRQHVMHDYLDKERQNPHSADIRITKAGRKRKRSSVKSSSNPAAPSNIFAKQTQTTAVVRSERSPPTLPTEEDVVSTAHMPSPEVVLPKPVKFVDDISPLVRGIAGGFDNSRYLRVSPESIPGPIAQAYLGSNIQPFDCWPTLGDPTLSVEQLKWSCSRHFGSYGISQHWIPELLKAKHAFLSTICISASHDDIMMRGQQAPHERKPYGSTDRLKVRSEVLGLINQALADPAMQTTDATLMSVLHVLNSEIMGCDDRIMRIHQHGLDDLVKERGGLGKLGIDGQLASILTITMFLISALRETEPDPIYARYARQHRAVSHNTSRQIPESPLYVRPTGYETIKRAVQETSPTFHLLELLRRIPAAFLQEENNPLGALPGAISSVTSLRDQIFALPSSDTLAFPSTHTRCQYEALRLTALVYSHALASRIPFSSASAQLSRVYNSSTAHCNLSSDHLHNSDIGSLSWHILIKTALIRTNLSDCWGHMAGVLFFITLIAGACANPDSDCNKSRRELSVEEEEGRKWLAAITVRCSIVLSFEFGEVVLETLKRLVSIERVLGEGGGSSSRSSLRYDDGDAGIKVHGRSYGPAEVPLAQHTFADYAQDFMAG